MNRFDVGVIVVTFVVLGVMAIIRNVVVPIVRLRVSKYYLASGSRTPDDQLTGVRSQVQETERRKLERENRISLDELASPLDAAAKDQPQ